MKATHFIIFALVVFGIALPAVCAEEDLESPRTCAPGSEAATGEVSCSDASASLHIVSYENSIEQFVAASPVSSFADLAQHVLSVSEKALGFPAVVSEESLASLAWYFRFRHVPAPLVIAKSSTRYDVARLVRFVVTDEKFRARHHLKECKINALIEAVKASVETDNGFVFRIFEGEDEEYPDLYLHQLPAIQHYFAAVHSEGTLFVSVVSSEILGEFIKGHGGENAVLERAAVDEFLRQWLLNQWVNLWVCTNPHYATGLILPTRFNTTSATRTEISSEIVGGSE